MFSTYLLKSQNDDGNYSGHTIDPGKRLKRHNNGKVKSPKSRIPFIIHFCEMFQAKPEAYRRELFFKSFEAVDEVQ